MKTQSQAKRKLSKGKNVSTAQDQSGKNSGRQSSLTAKTESGLSRSEEHESQKCLPISAEEFDRRFDNGESLDSLGVDLSKARRPA